jgi:hypothetical protein
MLSAREGRSNRDMTEPMQKSEVHAANAGCMPTEQTADKPSAAWPRSAATKEVTTAAPAQPSFCFIELAAEGSDRRTGQSVALGHPR